MSVFTFVMFMCVLCHCCLVVIVMLFFMTRVTVYVSNVYVLLVSLLSCGDNYVVLYDACHCLRF